MDTPAAIARFAGRHIAPREDLQAPTGFPFDLWREMGRGGLLGLGLPPSFGGGGADLRGLVAAGRALARGGRNLGIALAWLAHTAVSRFLILGFGSPEQRARYLPDLAAGRLTAAVAISEPEAGAHPKRLSTRAVRVGERYVLDGEKAYLTNGPIADLFVVLGVSGIEGGRKRFTAFLVTRGSPGLTPTETGALDELRPARHGGLRLKGCEVPAAAVLGVPGAAFETMGRPLRAFEDALLGGPLTGGLEAELDLLAEVASRRRVPVTDRMIEEMGGLRALGAALGVLAGESADAHEGGEPRGTELDALLLAVRQMGVRFQEGYTALREGVGLDGDPSLDTLTRDVSRLLSLGENTNQTRLRRLGAWPRSGEG